MGNKLYVPEIKSQTFDLRPIPIVEAYLYRIMLVMMSGEFLQTWDAFCLGYKCTDKI